MAEHTPGPWHQTDETDLQVIQINGPRKNERIAVMVRAATAVGQSNEVYANARLIAAAPVLLDELKRAMSFIGDARPFYDGTADAYSAIAKAEGRS